MQILYFARRDKKAVDVVAKLSSSQVDSVALAIHKIADYMDVIPSNVIQKIVVLQSKRQMDWQLYVENFAGYEDFKRKLVGRGYRGLPASIAPMIYSGEEITKLPSGSSKKMLQKRKN